MNQGSNQYFTTLGAKNYQCMKEAYLKSVHFISILQKKNHVCDQTFLKCQILKICNICFFQFNQMMIHQIAFLQRETLKVLILFENVKSQSYQAYLG